MSCIGGVAVFAAEGFGDGEVFEGGGDEGGDGAGEDGFDERTGWHLGVADAVGFDFAEGPDGVVDAVLVDAVGDACEEDEDDGAAPECEQPDGFAVFAPALAHLLHQHEDEDAA